MYYKNSFLLDERIYQSGSSDKIDCTHARRVVRATIPEQPNPVRLKSLKSMSTLGGRVLRFFNTHLAGDRSEVCLFTHTSPRTNEMFHHDYPVVSREFSYLHFMRRRG